jgi:hypothetical protein
VKGGSAESNDMREEVGWVYGAEFVIRAGPGIPTSTLP